MDIVENAISVHQDKGTVPTIVLQTANSDKKKCWLKKKSWVYSEYLKISILGAGEMAHS